MAADELEELIDFLGHKNPAVRLHAVELVQGLTATPEGVARLAARSERLLPLLFRLAGGAADAGAAAAALGALVNLSQDPEAAGRLLAAGAVARCMDFLTEGDLAGSPAAAARLVMLLANLSAAEGGPAALCARDGLHVAVLLQRFLDPALQRQHGGEDPYEHVASVLPNVTQAAPARRLLLEPGRGLLPALASQLRAASATRRRGAAGAIKNCCFSADADGTLGDVLAAGDALDAVLALLSGPPADAAAAGGAPAAPAGGGGGEDDGAVREALAEAVLCLARTEAGRAALWRHRAPELLGRGYELEEHPGVCAAMEAAAEIFLAGGFQPEAAGGVAAGALGGGAHTVVEELPAGGECEWDTT